MHCKCFLFVDGRKGPHSPVGLGIGDNVTYKYSPYEYAIWYYLIYQNWETVARSFRLLTANENSCYRSAAGMSLAPIVRG